MIPYVLRKDYNRIYNEEVRVFLEKVKEMPKEVKRSREEWDE
jgi:hypothetical protein